MYGVMSAVVYTHITYVRHKVSALAEQHGSSRCMVCELTYWKAWFADCSRVLLHVQWDCMSTDIRPEEESHECSHCPIANIVGQRQTQ